MRGHSGETKDPHRIQLGLRRGARCDLELVAMGLLVERAVVGLSRGEDAGAADRSRDVRAVTIVIAVDRVRASGLRVALG